jgi:hypothetical protein
MQPARLNSCLSISNRRMASMAVMANMCAVKDNAAARSLTNSHLQSHVRRCQAADLDFQPSSGHGSQQESDGMHAQSAC